MDSFSREILKLQEAGNISQFEDRFALKNSPCLIGSTAAVGSANERITFMSVYGLWVILASGLVVGALVMLVVRWRRQNNWAKIAEELDRLPKVTGTGKNAGRKLVQIDSELDRSKTSLIQEET